MVPVAVQAGLLTGAGYVTGTVLHELSHVATVIGTGSRLKRVRWRQTAVEYDPTGQQADWWVKATPTLLTPLVVGMLLLSVEGYASKVIAFGLLAGFIPRDISEYVAVGQLLVAGSEK